MLFFQYLLALCRQFKYHMKRKVYKMTYIHGIPYCDCLKYNSWNYSCEKPCPHGFPYSPNPDYQPDHGN